MTAAGNRAIQPPERPHTSAIRGECNRRGPLTVPELHLATGFTPEERSKRLPRSARAEQELCLDPIDALRAD